MDPIHTDASLLDQVTLLTLEKSHLLELVKQYLSCLVQAEGKLADFRILLDIKEAEIDLLRGACRGLGDKELRSEVKECRAEIGELKRENGNMRALIQAGLDVEKRSAQPREDSEKSERGLEALLAELAEVTQERNELKYEIVPKLQQALRLSHLEKTELEQKLSLPKNSVSGMSSEPPTQTAPTCLLSKQRKGGYQPLSMRKRATKTGVQRGIVRPAQTRK